jgi:hypothetical protein
MVRTCEEERELREIRSVDGESSTLKANQKKTPNAEQNGVRSLKAQLNT